MEFKRAWAKGFLVVGVQGFRRNERDFLGLGFRARLFGCWVTRFVFF